MNNGRIIFGNAIRFGILFAAFGVGGCVFSAYCCAILAGDRKYEVVEIIAPLNRSIGIVKVCIVSAGCKFSVVVPLVEPLEQLLESKACKTSTVDISDRNVRLAFFERSASFGWPFSSITLKYRDAPRAFSSMSLDICDHKRTLFATTMAVPALRHISSVDSGFAWCTLFYGTVALVATTCFRYVTRLNRRRRGQCDTCGYSMTGIAATQCPECGGLFRQRFHAGF